MGPRRGRHTDIPAPFQTLGTLTIPDLCMHDCGIGCASQRSEVVLGLASGMVALTIPDLAHVAGRVPPFHTLAN